MASISIRLPSLLTSLLGVPGSVNVSADTLQEAVDSLCENWPSLRVHLFDESGLLREHVLCFLNDTNTSGVEASNIALRDGDAITFLQAVSGG